MKRQLLTFSAAVAGLVSCLVLAASASAISNDLVHFSLASQGSEGTLSLKTSDGRSWTCPVGGVRRCGLDLERGTVMSISAAGTTASPFLRWDGSRCDRWAGTCNVTLTDADTSVTAFFSTRLVLTSFGRGSIGWETSDGSAPEAYKCGGWASTDYCAAFAYGAKLRLRSRPSTGAHMSGWGGGCNGIAATYNCLLTMAGSQVVTASYEDDAPSGSTCPPNSSCDGVTVTIPFTVRVVGAGTVAAARVRTIGAKTCSAYTMTGFVCTSFAALRDTWLELRAIPSAGGKFLGWSGLCYGNSTCRIKTSRTGQTLTAQFG